MMTSPAHPGQRSRAAALFGGMVALFGLDVLLTTGLGAQLSAEFGSSAQDVATLVALTLGAALLLTPAAARLADRGRSRTLLLCSCALLVIASCCMALAFAVRSLPVLVAAVLVFGLSRAVSIIIALASVATLPFDAHRMQGINGAVQRFGSVVAAILAGLVIARQNWVLGDLVLIGATVAWAAGAWWAGRGAAALARARRSGDEAAPPSAAGPESRPWHAVLQSYPIAIRLLLHDRAVLASGLVNFMTIVSIIATNTFLPLALAETQPPEAAGATVALTLTVREVVAILAGLLFARFGRFLGIRAALLLAIGLMMAAFIGLVGGTMQASPALLVVAGAAQGIALSLCIATTNLLVLLGIAERPTHDITLRLAATQLPPALAVLVLTPVLGLIFEHLSGGVFATCAGLTVAVGLCILLLVRRVLTTPEGPRRRRSRSTVP